MAKMFLNGEIIDEVEAKVSVLDSGYYFGDGIYEVILLYNGKLIDKDLHLDRLESCFKKVYFKNCPSREQVLSNIELLLKHNPDVKTASIYMQFTRGCTQRGHCFSELNLTPSFMIKLIPCEIRNNIKQWNCKVIDDPRRFRCDIKMISLMPMILAKYEAEQEGYDDVIFYNKNLKSITEGSSFNLFVVNNDGSIITCPNGNEILPGCTRTRVIDILNKNNIKVEERYFSKDELLQAKEVFITGSIKLIVSVIKVNNKKIGDGEVGSMTKFVSDKMFEFLNEQ